MATSPRSANVLRRAGRVLTTLGFALTLILALAPTVFAVEENTYPSDTRATHAVGNATTTTECPEGPSIGGNLADPDSDDYASGSFSTGTLSADFGLDINGDPTAHEDVQVLNVTVSDDVEVLGVWIKAGNGYNRYDEPVDNMIAPLNNSGSPAGVSHWFMCYELVPDLELEKSVEPATVEPGGSATFTLTVTNTGTATATGVVITDTLPDGLTAGEAPEGCEVDGQTVTCTVEELAPEGSESFDIPVTTEADVCTVYENDASVSGNEAEQDTDNNAASAELTAAGCAPDLSIDKSASASEVDGAPAEGVPGWTYTITVTNSGNASAEDVHVVDDLDDALTLSLPANCTAGEAVNSVDCDLGDIAAGDDASVDIPVTAPHGVCAAYDNEASIAGTELSDDATVTTTGCNPAIELTKAADVPLDTDGFKTVNFILGGATTQNVEYDFVVTNTGNVTLTAIEITDTLLTGDITLEATELAPGASTTGTGTMTVLSSQAGSTLPNVATVTGVDPNGTEVDDEDDDSIRVASVGGVVIDRGPEPAPAPAPNPEVEVKGVQLARTGPEDAPILAITAAALIALGVLSLTEARRREQYRHWRYAVPNEWLR